MLFFITFTHFADKRPMLPSQHPFANPPLRKPPLRKPPLHNSPSRYPLRHPLHNLPSTTSRQQHFSTTPLNNLPRQPPLTASSLALPVLIWLEPGPCHLFGVCVPRSSSEKVYSSERRSVEIKSRRKIIPEHVAPY